MKKTLIGIVASGALALGYAPSAEAAAFLQINVGGTIVSCNNTVACGAGFSTSLNSGDISFTGTVNGVTFAGSGATAGIQLVSNAPGGVVSFATDTKTTMTNTTGGSLSVEVSFAVNDFSLPVGNQIFFNATQGVTAIISSTAMSSAFSGFGNGANTLTPGAGSSSVTPACNTLAAAGFSNSCATNGPISAFVRSGNFALSGIESYTLAGGAQINASGTVTAIAAPVPEPGSMLLLGTGLFALASRVRRRLGKK